MEEQETYGPVVGIVIVIAILFFGGWYVFLGNKNNNPATPTDFITLPTSTETLPVGTSTLPTNEATNTTASDTDPTI